MNKKACVFLALVVSTIAVRAQVPVKNLDFFLNEVKKQNPLLKDLANQQQVAKIDSMLVRAGTRPQITGSATGMYAPVIKGYGYNEVITNGQLLEAMLNVNYDLLNRKRIVNQLQGIKLQADSIKYVGQLFNPTAAKVNDCTRGDYRLDAISNGDRGRRPAPSAFSHRCNWRLCDCIALAFNGIAKHD